MCCPGFGAAAPIWTIWCCCVNGITPWFMKVASPSPLNRLVGDLPNPTGNPMIWWVDDQNLARHLDFALRRQRTRHDRLAMVDSFQHPDAQTIRPRWTGEPFDLHACIQALFTIKLPQQTTELDQQAA
jgi:hypothetical protein